MNTKIITLVVALALLGIIAYVASSPREVAAPVDTPTEQAAPTGDTASETETAPLSENSNTEPTPTTKVSPQPAPSASKSAPVIPYTASVIYDGKQFIPEEVMVIQGGKVTFYNQSDTKMWIATDNHPTHDRYPIKNEASCSGNAFDQCASVSKGGSWTFTFDRTSTWGYHNHMEAAHHAKVVVKTVEEYLDHMSKENPEMGR